MIRPVIFSLVILFGIYGLVSGDGGCYKCHDKDCTLLDTTIQTPCPHYNNICYTVVDRKTCTVFEKGCADPGVCDVFTHCEECDGDLCNSGVNFECSGEPCKGRIVRIGD
ncbi:hypothetical protein FQR65_LT01855 [Abscondita terminalis]|nr:hypothetical protein FQR65_LT01855 [Abscondita terminalis]